MPVGFAAALALTLGAFVVLPWIAHRLRRSPPTEVPFAPLRFVPEAAGPSELPSGIDDRLLFAVRALLVLLLSVLAAGPRVRTSALALREGDEDATVVLVLDDSASMRTRDGRTTRLEAAKAELLHVLDELDGGDRAAIVLAGKPARVLRGFSQDLSSVRSAVAEVEPTDRATDLSGAVARAEELVGEGGEARGVAVVATDTLQGGGGAVETRLRLRSVAIPAARRDDCGVVSASAVAAGVRAKFACEKSGMRDVRWRGGDREVVRRGVELREGVTELVIDVPGASVPGRVELIGGDALPDDDAAEVVAGVGRMRIAVLERTLGVDDEDRTPPALLRALEAAAPDAELVRMARIPTDDSLADLDVLAVDDALPWSADERLAVQSSVDEGLALWLAFGPASTRGSLGSSFEPFVEGAVGWEPGAFDVRFPDDSSAPVRGRARFVAEAFAGTARVLFSDGVPYLVRGTGRPGMVTLVATPADPRVGDAALRGAFVEAIEVAVDAARRARPHAELHAGEAIRVPAGTEVLGPRGRIRPDPQLGEGFVSLPHAGIYRVRSGSREQVRQVTIDASEIASGTVTLRSSAEPVEARPVLRDRSVWVVAAFVVAGLAEIALRVRLRMRRTSAR